DGQSRTSGNGRQEQRAIVPRENYQPMSGDILRRVPPQNLEAEESVLGAIFLEPDYTWGRVTAIMSSEDCYREAHRIIFRGFAELRKRGEPIDAVTMAALLRAKGKLEEVGGAAYIADLAARVPVAYHCEAYA